VFNTCAGKYSQRDFPGVYGSQAWTGREVRKASEKTEESWLC